MGEAPELALHVFPALIAAILLELFFPGAFRFEGRARGIAFAAGIELAAFGLAFWLSAAIGLLSAFRAGTLATRGAYGLCRHPIFSWWILFILPPLALILDSWIFLAVAVVFRVVAGPAAKREEESLVKGFGETYRKYASRVRAFLPIPHFRPFAARRYAKAAGFLALSGVCAIAVLVVTVAPLATKLGTRNGESEAAMPGDSAIARPKNTYTQAITIMAPPAEVWKWLVQVGYKRAGWYNFDAINRLAGKDYFIEGSGSARSIHPELQGIRKGDKIFLVPQLGLEITELEENSLLVMQGDPLHPEAEYNVAWTYLLKPEPDGSTRLITRFRGTYPPGFVSTLANSMVNVVGGAIIQQPAMLRGLADRAEKAHRADARGNY